MPSSVPVPPTQASDAAREEASSDGDVEDARVEGYDFTISFRDAKEDAIARFERRYIRELLAQHQGNLSRAARAVRMDRNDLRDLARRHDIPICTS